MKAIKKIMKKIKINKEDVPDNISNNKYNNSWKKINVNEEKKIKKIVIMISNAKILKWRYPKYFIFWNKIILYYIFI